MPSVPPIKFSTILMTPALLLAASYIVHTHSLVSSLSLGFPIAVPSQGSEQDASCIEVHG